MQLDRTLSLNPVYPSNDMPTYLCHGFRWHRPSIRVFVIVQDLDDASPDWIIRPATTRSLLDAFYHLFDFLPPHNVEADADAVAAAATTTQKARETAAATQEQRGRGLSTTQTARTKSRSRKDKKDKAKDNEAMQDDAHGAPGPKPTPGVVRHNDGRDEILAMQDDSAVKLLEEYDPQRLDEMSRPHAYVTDYVARIDLSVSVVDEMARYERLQQQRWRREHKTRDGFPSMAGPSDEGSNLGAAMGNGEGGNGSGTMLSKKKKGSGWLEQLRDQLQRGEEIRWYIVVNNDEERFYPDMSEDDEEDDDATEDEAGPAATESSRQRDAREEETIPGRRTSLDELMDQAFAKSAAMAPTPRVDNREGDHERQQDPEREIERQRQRLRLQLTGDANILSTWDSAQSSLPPVATRLSYRQEAGGLAPERASVATASASAPAAPKTYSLTPKSSSLTPQQPLQQSRPPPQPPSLSSPALRPKTPHDRPSGSASGFRRLFGRSSRAAVHDATKS